MNFFSPIFEHGRKPWPQRLNRMKRSLAIAWVLGLSLLCPNALAQTDGAPAAPPPAAAPQEFPVSPDAPGVAIEAPAEQPAAAPAPPSAPVDLAPVRTADALLEERGPLTLEHELPAAIQFLARMAGINIHFDPNLSFTNAVPNADGSVGVPVVSLRWENVTAEDALNEVLDIHGLQLTMNQKTGIARVVRKPVIDPLITTVVHLKYSNPTNMTALVQSSFAEPQRFRVMPDARTSQLVLVTTERELEAITNLIAQLDTPTKQVLIEARILEMAKNPRSVKGIDWSGTLEGQNVTFGNGRTTGTTTTTTPGATTTTVLPSGRTVTSQTGSSVTTELTTALGLGGMSMDTTRGFHPSTAFLNADGVRAVLSFLNTDNDTEVVATPRQVTLDNQTAVLSVTRAFPIFEITPGSAQTPPTAQVTYTNLGTILRVTPRIAAHSNINLKVVPEVSNIDSKDRQIINGDVNEANVYAIRKMETEVIIPSGNTLVMGGLVSDTVTKTYSKVPLLGDLPGIGLAFRRDTKSRNKANLLIFVTPTIVADSDFQPTQTDFLQNKMKEKPETDESAWNSGKPYQWKKKD